ncbi:TRAFAC clade GTPase domain-containing protein [Sphingomonas sp.]|uniref:TRAFAC clade GTPase domain-containing protein n=1 Tax=Sphingomonas sp. TaxID=28214 RepID=UPI0028AAB7C8|nr:hypothetical protein [Sphingomonas sp.]
MITDLSKAVCRQPGCGGPISGVCINQLPFDECPDVVPPEDAEPGEPASAETEPDTVSTGRMGVLSIHEADAFLRAYGGLVLAVVAAPNAGKTTFASALYDLLRRGLLEGFGFAGSETIKGLEERCFDSRVASGEDKPTTLRTRSVSPLIFIHLRIAVPDGRQLDVLLSDRSGEHFDRALNTPAQFADFHEIGRANAILLLVDGQKLVTSHQAEIAGARKLILALAQSGYLANKNVHLVVTKTDLLEGALQRTLVEQRVAVLAEEVQRRGKKTHVEVHLIACRARKGQSSFGEGVQRLIEANLPAVTDQSFTTTFWTPNAASTSSLDRLMFVTRWQ